MKEKGGFFSFFRGISSRVDEISSEEKKQREYAKAQEQNIDTSENELENKLETIPNNAIQLTEEEKTFCVTTLKELLTNCGFEAETEITKQDNDKIFIEINNNDDIGRIIGKEGQNLEALQTLIRAIAYKKFNRSIKVILDAGDYRQKRTGSLKSIALRAAKSVMQRKTKIELMPMNAAERRLIHVMFKNHKRVRSFSVGEGIDRHVVLECKNGRAEKS